MNLPSETGYYWVSLYGKKWQVAWYGGGAGVVNLQGDSFNHWKATRDWEWGARVKPPGGVPSPPKAVSFVVMNNESDVCINYAAEEIPSVVISPYDGMAILTLSSGTKLTCRYKAGDQLNISQTIGGTEGWELAVNGVAQVHVPFSDGPTAVDSIPKTMAIYKEDRIVGHDIAGPPRLTMAEAAVRMAAATAEFCATAARLPKAEKGPKCPDCKGSGTYQGCFTDIGPCQTCGGTG